MNEEQNSTGNNLVRDQDGSDKATPQDDYYLVDDRKKEIRTNIGDGEMHNEGLVGEGDITDQNPLDPDRLQDEQDEAEFHDSEG